LVVIAFTTIGVLVNNRTADIFQDYGIAGIGKIPLLAANTCALPKAERSPHQTLPSIFSNLP